eukprot:TRINITY_DN12221_c0_g1_i1.p1 TRINITY_DN12221_c0_g1~~TRINITY_DN12221_c0_g1_i1.p1  ORF type:complete len:104 (+),score=6.27 TRINITY_DN12221_c0_g1_i1:59-370(+)
MAQRWTGSALLAESITRTITPVVMVLSDPEAETTCRRSGLSFADMLRPFCDLRNINVPVRTAGEHSYRLQDFRVRILHTSDIRQPSLEGKCSRDWWLVLRSHL